MFHDSCKYFFDKIKCKYPLIIIMFYILDCVLLEFLSLLLDFVSIVAKTTKFEQVQID